MIRTWVISAAAVIPCVVAAYPMNEGLTIDLAAVCTRVVDRQPREVGEEFGAEVGTLFCFTRVIGVREETTITHVWYAGDEKVFEYALPVRPPTWRTWSEKNIPPTRKGPWHVDIVGPGGEVLHTVAFSIR